MAFQHALRLRTAPRRAFLGTHWCDRTLKAICGLSWALESNLLPAGGEDTDDGTAGRQ